MSKIFNIMTEPIYSWIASLGYPDRIPCPFCNVVMVCTILIQDKEAHLDIIMDRMRQDATEKQLKDSLDKALDMLQKIKDS